MPGVAERIEALRGLMEQRGLSHYLIPSEDEHLNEYPPPWRWRRQWASGFTGSAGDLLVGCRSEDTWLFADGRYHLQAERELRGSGIGLQKVGVPGAKTLRDVLRDAARQGGAGCVVGCDPMLLSVATADSLGRALRAGGGELRSVTPNLVDLLWADRPPPPQTPLLACPLEWTGCSVADKLARVRETLAQRDADALVLARLDEIAWLLNLRSLDDIPFNPVFEAYLYLDADEVHLFLRSPELRLPPGYPAQVAGFHGRQYGEFLTFLARCAPARVSLAPGGVARGVLDALTRNPQLKVARGASPVAEAKAVKNEVEQACMARANLRASVAKTRALLWLERRLADGEAVTEQGFAARLEGDYAALEGFRQLSFPTIAATGANAAIVHYSEAGPVELRPGDLFLVDSGVHLDGGSTDDTRTVAVGTPSAEQRRLYTTVLQGHIAGASQVFPEGTPGAAIDAVTRGPLWREGLEYDHGTGHGVGAFLNVHEGPFALVQAKRRPHGSHPLEAGMVTSIEPGCYKSGFAGIRLENLYLVKPVEPGDDGRRWLGFEPLTWIPFDLRLIDRERLTGPECRWLDGYHDQCLERLAPHLSAAEVEQLRSLLGAGPPR